MHVLTSLETLNDMKTNCEVEYAMQSINLCIECTSFRWNWSQVILHVRNSVHSCRKFDFKIGMKQKKNISSNLLISNYHWNRTLSIAVHSPPYFLTQNLRRVPLRQSIWFHDFILIQYRKNEDFSIQIFQMLQRQIHLADKGKYVRNFPTILNR